MSAGVTERIEIWNTFFKLARDEAISLRELQDPNWKAPPHSFLGGILGNAEVRSPAIVAWCYLAVEARVNHLTAELRDNGLLTVKEAKAVSFLKTEEKWALLPKLAGKNTTINFNQPPHQAVTQLCSLRNDLFHVNYERLLRKLPRPRTAMSLFNNFVEAMEDMKVILGRHTRADPNVLRIALR